MKRSGLAGGVAPRGGPRAKAKHRAAPVAVESGLARLEPACHGACNEGQAPRHACPGDQRALLMPELWTGTPVTPDRGLALSLAGAALVRSANQGHLSLRTTPHASGRASLRLQAVQQQVAADEPSQGEARC